MIAYLEGTTKKKLEKAIIVQTAQGVGYLVHTPLPVFESLQENKEVELFIHTRVREDNISLYGFDTYANQELFETVTSISGVGPKTGLEILSHDITKVKTAILNEDVAFLSQLHGIGKKTAERIIVELKNKITPDSLDHIHQGLTTSTPQDEVLDAILSLGYQQKDIAKTLKNMPENITKTEDIITYFLKHV